MEESACTVYAASSVNDTVLVVFAISIGSLGRSGKTHKPVHGSLTPHQTNFFLYSASQCFRVCDNASGVAERFDGDK